MLPSAKAGSCHVFPCVPVHKDGDMSCDLSVHMGAMVLVGPRVVRWYKAAAVTWLDRNITLWLERFEV